ncbi:MAG: ATP-binding protein [Deltaproteobacteria bacterium]|nr:ATP-binding protein [Deltaproteobacteria bacterium]
MDFIDREHELSFLEEKWKEDKAQFIVLWGKRRVGKTELVKRFIKNKPGVYFLSESVSPKDQLSRFSKTIGGFFEEPLLLTRGFTEWEEMFEYVFLKKKKFVLIIDEFPYLFASNPAILTIFQKAWDEYWSKSDIFLIILGSSISMMENEVLGYRSPLYGRRTAQWMLNPLPFKAAASFRKEKPFEDKLLHFAVAGGIPEYWLKFDPSKSFKENLLLHIIKKGEFLYDEPEFILRKELREPRYYFSILKAIAQGKRKNSEIINATGINNTSLNKYLGVLSDLKIIERELPATEEKPLKSKKGLYKITDEFFRFWFRFVFPKRSDIEFGKSAELLSEILNELPQYMGSVYEKAAKDILIDNQRLYFTPDAIGRWWDKNEEIDIVAINKNGRQPSILFCEVKWTQKPVGKNIYESLKEKAKKVDWNRDNRIEYFSFFSKSGFTEEMIKMAASKNILLFKEDKLQIN